MNADKIGNLIRVYPCSIGGLKLSISPSRAASLASRSQLARVAELWLRPQAAEWATRCLPRGLLGLALLPMTLLPEKEAIASGGHSFNEVLPLMMSRYLGPGLLGLGVTSLIAGFMSGMAGNVSAFATVWTYDIYRPLIRKTASDQHYVSMGRWCTLIGVFISIGTAYLVMEFSSILIYVQVLVTFFIVPLFGTVIMGMLWKGATPAGGFWGQLAGMVSSIAMWLWVKFDPSALRYITLSPDAKDMAENMYRGLWSLLICVGVTWLVSLMTKPKSNAELKDLVYGLTPLPSEGHYPLLQRPIFWAAVCAAILVVVNIIFW